MFDHMQQYVCAAEYSFKRTVQDSPWHDGLDSRAAGVAPAYLNEQQNVIVDIPGSDSRDKHIPSWFTDQWSLPQEQNLNYIPTASIT